ncbi:MAG: PAS domain-containing protein, partial [Rhizomicrobium sp.]
PPTQRIGTGEIQNAKLRKAFDLWTKLKGTRNFPARSEISPRDLTDFLRNTVLVRVLDGGNEFQFRIVGDAIVLAQGQSFQGLTTAEIEVRLPGYGVMVKRAYRRVHNERKPLVLRGWFEHAVTKRAFFHETLGLPLGPDDETVDHILVVAVFAFSEDGAPA